MNWKLLLAMTMVLGARSVFAQDALSDPEPERDPAAVSQSLNVKRNYPGGLDEEDLQVQASIPEAALHTDSRTLQREVYKSLYNQELKDDRQDAVEE